MIRFVKNAELDMAMKNLVMSMVNVREYITEVLEYMDKYLSPGGKRGWQRR